MQRRPIVALCIAVLAAILIILAGKSCAEDIARTNQSRRKPVSTTTMPPNFVIGTDNPPPAPEMIYETEENETETTSDFFYHIPTDEYGAIIETTAPTEAGQMFMVVTDANGNVINMEPVTEPTSEAYTTLSPEEVRQALTEALEQASRQAQVTTFDFDQPIEIPFIKE